MRIYFVGSHATGKTTLCRYVSRRFGLPMITEVARAVLAEMESSLDALRTDMELVAEYLKELKNRGISVLLVEQKLTIALEISQRCYVMGHGSIVFEGTPADLKAGEAIRREWLEV